MSKKYLQYKAPKSSKFPTRPTPNTVREMSDSEESTKSVSSDTGGSCKSDDLTILAEYEDLIRLVKQQTSTEDMEKFIEFAEQAKGVCAQWQESIKKCKRLQIELAKVTHDYSDFESKLGLTRKMLDQAKKRSRRVEDERDELAHKIDLAAQLLFNKHNRLPDNLLRELGFLQRESAGRLDMGVPQLSAIHEVNTTGSLISESNISYSRSEGDLDTSPTFRNKCSSTMESQRRSGEFVMEPPVKKRRSVNSKVVEINTTDTVRATTTLIVSKGGPITATSIIESVPPDAAKNENDFRPSTPPAHLVYNNRNNMNGSNANIRQHSFQNKLVMIPETCGPCNERIKFGRNVYKCLQCRAYCHPECKDLVPLPCIPGVNTPQKGVMGKIGDYTPPTSPMVPALIVHCTREVENRGYNELGIYRIPGSEKEVKSLKEKFLKGKGSPCINQVDVHVICDTIKDFLRSLQEPLVTYSRRADFIKAAEVNNSEAALILNQIISELPQPNRDTLAYVILHLKRVSNMPKCKMTADNLAKIFGPTIIGYSSSCDYNSEQLFTETRQQFMIMDQLLNLAVEFWEAFLESNGSEFKTPTGKLQQTPSTDSLLYPKSRAIFSPYNKSARKRKQKFFPSPVSLM